MKSSSLPDYSDLRDCDLLTGIANGDRSHFHMLHDQYQNLLYSVIFKILNDRQDTEEVLQEVFFALWRKAGLFHPGRGRPVTWLTSMARNRAIDRLRAKQRQAKLRESCAQEQATVPQTFGHNSITGLEAAERRDRCEAVRNAVVQLTPAQREAIEMAYFRGMTQKDIARHLNKPVGTVKARIRRGMERLRHTMASKS